MSFQIVPGTASVCLHTFNDSTQAVDQDDAAILYLP